jgi:outer membrane usher protein
MVGQGGQIYARVEDNTGKLTVKWGKQDGQRCEIKYRLPKADNQPVTQIHLPCGGDNRDDDLPEKKEKPRLLFSC